MYGHYQFTEPALTRFNKIEQRARERDRRLDWSALRVGAACRRRRLRRAAAARGGAIASMARHACICGTGADGRGRHSGARRTAWRYGRRCADVLCARASGLLASAPARGQRSAAAPIRGGWPAAPMYSQQRGKCRCEGTSIRPATASVGLIPSRRSENILDRIRVFSTPAVAIY